jgi:hypothetical protein
VFVACGLVFVELSVFIPIVTLKIVGLLGQKLQDCVNNSAEDNGLLYPETIETE